MTVVKQARGRRTISSVVIIQRFSLTGRNILEYTERTTLVCYMQRLCWYMQLYAKVLVKAICKDSVGSDIQMCLVVAIYKCSSSYIQWFQWQLYAKVFWQLYAKVLVVAICKGSSGSLYAKVLVVATCICMGSGCSYMELQ